MTTLIERPAPSRSRAAVALPIPPPARRRRRVTPASIARAVAIPVVVFLVSSLLTYGLGALSPSNPAAAVLGDAATPADIARMNHQFGLDRPFLEQYVTWLGHAFSGDLGRSYFTTIPVSHSIAAAIPVDLGIAGLALLLAVLLGGAAGITAALRRGGRVDRAITLVASALATLPPFVIGISLIVVFSVWAHAFPAGGYAPLSAGPTTWFRFAILPAVALSLDLAAAIARQLRTSLVAQLGENYVVGAAVRGQATRRIVLGQVLRNAAGPALTVLGSGIPMLLGGAVVTEKIFNLPGVAQLALQASTSHDVPLIQGTLLVTAAVVLVCNTAVNGTLSLLTPQARSPRTERSS
jgi:peptide/nickel transport system permease protein